MDDVSGYAPPRLENPVTLSKYRELVSNSTDDVGMDDGVKTVGMKGKILATSVNDDGVVFHFCCKERVQRNIDGDKTATLGPDDVRSWPTLT